MPTDNNSQHKELETVSIPAVEIFSEGSWNGDVYSHDDLQAMVDAFDKVGFEPTIKAGHADGQEDEKKARLVFGAPALGYAKRIYLSGKKLIADLGQVPRRFADLIKAGAFKKISAEIYWSYKHEASGKTFPRVLKSVAFLGTEIPALTDLKAIEALYDKNAAGSMFAYDENKNEFRAYCMDCSAGLVAPGVPFSDYLLRYPRKSKELAGYRASEGEEKCINCKFWIGGFNACSVVEGWIEPDGVSDFYEVRPGLAMMKKKDDDEVREYNIEKRGDEYCLIAGDGKVLGCHDSRAGAEAQERAVQANKNELLITAKQMEEICPPCAEKMRQKNFSAIKLLPMMSESGVLTYAFPGGMPQDAFEALCGKFGPDEGFRTRCMDSSAGAKADDPGAFCNSLKTACKDQALLSSDQPAKEYAMEVKEKDGQFCVMDGETTVKCYPTRAEADAHVKKLSKEGGPNMDEKKFEQEKAQLIADKKSADEKAKQYQDKLAALEAANEEAKGKESEALQEVKKLKRERWDDQIGSWVAAQKRAGKLAPVEESRLAAIFSALYEDQRTVTFSQADGDKTKEVKESLADAIKAFIVNRPSIFKEMSLHTDEPPEPLPNPGDEVDRRAKDYQSKNKDVAYPDACKAVLRADPELNERYMRIQN